MNREMRRMLAKGRASALLSEVAERDYTRRPSLIEASGGGKRGYDVQLEWNGTFVHVSCQCQGSRRGFCFHEVGAVIKALEELGSVAMSPYKGNLALLARTGGVMFTIEGTWKTWYALVKVTSNKMVYREVDLPGELISEPVYST